MALTDAGICWHHSDDLQHHLNRGDGMVFCAITRNVKAAAAPPLGLAPRPSASAFLNGFDVLLKLGARELETAPSTSNPAQAGLGTRLVTTVCSTRGHGNEACGNKDFLGMAVKHGAHGAHTHTHTHSRLFIGVPSSRNRPHRRRRVCLPCFAGNFARSAGWVAKIRWVAHPCRSGCRSIPL